MRPLKLTSLLFAGLGLVAVSHPAYAQDGPEEIITTGVRQAYQGDFAPLETPASNLTIDSVALAVAGAQDLNQALDLSASVSRQNNFGGLWNSFALRGFVGDINVPSGYLVNGFNAGRGFSGPRDLAGIESVEVLKGPRSALYGRGEPGGTINLITKRPQFQNGGYVKGTAGSWDQYRVEGDVQGTVSGDGGDFGFRVVSAYEQADSFREGRETELFGIYPSVTVATADGPTLTYELEYTAQEIPQDRGVVFAENFGFSPRDVFTGENVPIETEVLGQQLEVSHDLTDNWSLLVGLGYRETTLEGRSFENQFGFRDTDGNQIASRQNFINDGQTIARFSRNRDFESDYFVIRGELSGEFATGSLRHRLIVGADYDEFNTSQVITRFRPRFRGDATMATPAETAANLLLDVTNPIYGQNLNPVGSPNTDRDEVFEAFGVYVQDQIDLTDNFQIRLGGRFDDIDQSLLNKRSGLTDSLSETRFSPQVGAVYLVNDGLSLYASYGEGFRQQTGVDFQGELLDPNVTESYEAGVKGDLGGLISGVDGEFTVALFNIDQSNVTVSEDRPIENPLVGFATRAAGEAQSRGLEADANFTVGDDMSFRVSYAYTDAEYLTDTGDADGFGFTIESGDPIINVPEHQLSLQAAKDFNLGTIPATIGGGLQYVGERNGFAGVDFTLPDYTTARIFGEAQLVDNILLRLDVDNLFDETFYTDSFADVWVTPGAPRRFRVSAKYNF